MVQWWGAGRRQAREQARQEAVAQQRELVDRALEQARQYPHTHVERWACLESLGAVDRAVVTAEAARLIRSGVQADAVLGAQLLDTVTFNLRGPWYPEGELLDLLDRSCRPQADPDLIEAALGVWLEGAPPDARARLEELLAHPSPTARARAGYLYAGSAVAPAAERFVLLAKLLDHDGDPRVRDQAAAGLLMMWREARDGEPDDRLDPDPRLAAELVACLRRHREDPSPAVRAHVFEALAENDPEPDLDWLLRELADPTSTPASCPP